MIRKIIKIDEEKCNGCTLCVEACHEGAIGMVDGKARLLRDDYCDGLGDCLPVCPTGAISFEEREALPFVEDLPCGCPGSNAKLFSRQDTCAQEAQAPQMTTATAQAVPSQLAQWPVQIKLVPVNAAYFKDANLLIAADCAAYAYSNFHTDYMRNKITLIGCPKLDQVDYAEKLTAILQSNDIKSVTVVRMEVPCCGGIENAVKTAMKNSGKIIPWQIVVLSTNGTVLPD